MKLTEINTVTLKNGEVYAYRKAGSGEKTVMLIHGNMSSSVHWQTTIDALAEDYAVVAPDLRGFGDSTYNNRFDSLNELAQDIEQCADALGVKEFAVCGWSTGGGVAMELAASRPDSVKSLILLDSVPPTGYPMFKKGADFQPILSEPLTTKEEIEADPVQVIPALNALKNGDKATMKAIWDMAIFNLNKPCDEDYDIYLDATMKQRNLVDVDFALLSFNMSRSAVSAFEATGRIDLIKCPVTILHGEKDLVVPLAWAQNTKALFGDRARFITFENAGHSPITDVPEEFFKVLKSVLN